MLPVFLYCLICISISSPFFACLCSSYIFLKWGSVLWVASCLLLPAYFKKFYCKTAQNVLHLIYNQRHSLHVLKHYIIFKLNFDTWVASFPGVLSAIMDIPSCSVPQPIDECWFGKIYEKWGVTKWLWNGWTGCSVLRCLSNFI